MKRVVAMLACLMLSGCASYFVESRTLDAYASLPRAQRRYAVVAATGADDGHAAFIRAGDARPEPVTDGTRRRVRVLRPHTAVGGVFLGLGVPWVAAGAAFISADSGAARSEDRSLVAALGIPLLAVGLADMTVGAILVATGVLTKEVGDPGPPRYELLH